MKFFSYCIFFLLFLSKVDAQILKVDSILIPYKYLVHIPEKKNASAKYPLMLFLHGAGERGNNIDLVRIHNPLSYYKDSLNFPFLFVAPQCPEGKQWDPVTLIHLLDLIEKKYPVDIDRVYIIGLSMGGRGAYDLGKYAGDRFAAIVSVCGALADTTDICMLRHIPIWSFHGEIDDTVPLSESENAIKALKNLGADAKLTVYPGVKHDSWNKAFVEPDLYTWLLKQKRVGRAQEISEKSKLQYVGKYIYHENSADSLITNVTYEKSELWYSVPRYSYKVKMYMVEQDLFRLEGVPLQKDSEILFIRNAQNKIIGQKYYPCDGTFVPKTE